MTSSASAEQSTSNKRIATGNIENDDSSPDVEKSYTLKVNNTTLDLEQTLMSFKKQNKLTDDDFELIRTGENNDSMDAKEISNFVFIRFFENKELLDKLVEFFKIQQLTSDTSIDYEIIETENDLNLQLPGNLYIRGLMPTTSSENLYNMFKPFGEIQSCKIIYDDFGVSKGFGFINFANRKQANDAIENLHGCNVDGNDLFINHHISKKERLKELEFRKMNYSNLYIKNIPLEFTTDQLFELFEKYGEIENVFIPFDKSNDNLNKGYGFINFKYHDDAMRAQDEMDGYEISDGFTIQIGRAERKKERYQYQALNSHFNTNNNFNLPPSTLYSPQDMLITSSGESIPTPRDNYNKPNINANANANASSRRAPTSTTAFPMSGAPAASSGAGAGAVAVAGAGAGAGAGSKGSLIPPSHLRMNPNPASSNVAVPPVTPNSNAGFDSTTIPRSIPSGSASILPPPFVISRDSNYISTASGLPIAGPQYQDSNLYITHIPLSLKDDDLQTLFEEFGQIISAKIMTYQPEEIEQMRREENENENENEDEEEDVKEGQSKGFGFVCFNRPLDASKALVSMNGYSIDDDHVLNVSFAQRKENKFEKGRFHHYNQNSLENFYQLVDYQRRSQSLPNVPQMYSPINGVSQPMPPHPSSSSANGATRPPNTGSPYGAIPMYTFQQPPPPTTPSIPGPGSGPGGAVTGSGGSLDGGTQRMVQTPQFYPAYNPYMYYQFVPQQPGGPPGPPGPPHHHHHHHQQQQQIPSAGMYTGIPNSGGYNNSNVNTPIRRHSYHQGRYNNSKKQQQ